MSDDDLILPKEERMKIKPVTPLYPSQKYDETKKRETSLQELKHEQEQKQKQIDEQNKKDGIGNNINKRL